jgi:putative transposase
VDAAGVPLAVETEGANMPDMCLFGPTLDHLEKLPIQRPEPTAAAPQGLCLDRGYDYPIVQELIEVFRFVSHLKRRGEEQAEKKRNPLFKARRWVVERTHSWFNRFRRLLIRWEKKIENYEGFLHVACGIICFRQTGLFG